MSAAARFEFRIFGQGLGLWHQRMARLSQPVPEKFWRRQSSETYLLSRHDQQHNIKLRSGMLDIKVLLGRQQGLEQWDVAAKIAMPSESDVLLQPLLPAIGLATLALPNTVDESTLLSAINTHPDLLAVRITKIRKGYLIDGAICEYAEVLLNDARVDSLAIEADHPDTVLETIRRLGLPAADNISYPEAIRRVIGWSTAHLVHGEE
ncbi:MAG: hypothetical protein ACK4SX_01805 [Alcanivoracaceae bacterium]